MPFTPIHMGPGILLKSILQGSFSLMIFGWTQIVMDLQPLIVMISGEGHLHGFTHTYLGALIIAVISALSGKYLSQIGLILIGVSPENPIKIKWWIAFLSALIGSLSHVYLDSIMHSDVQPFYPVLMTNQFYGLISVSSLHKLCLYSGLLGAIIYYSMNWSKIKIK
jgi:membrane-bound metal-dependent hydrolase YbcI (DUF457 family)